MKKATLFVILAALLAGCTAQFDKNAISPDKPSGEDSIFGMNLPDDAVDPERLNVLFDEETVAELERMTGEDGYVQLPKVKAFDGRGIVRMRRMFPEAGRFEARTRAEGLHRWYEIFYDAEASLTKAAQGWIALPGVEIVEFNPLIHIVGDPVLVEEEPTALRTATSSTTYPFNDPRLPSQWHYFNNGSAASSVSGCDINVFPVWKRYTTGSPEVIVGVVDGGVDFTHEDLAANMWHNPEKKGDAQYGYNFVNDSYIVTADDHGTHVAGTIAAVNNNNIGVSGIAGGDAAKGQPGVKIMSCQIFEGETGNGSGAAAIKWSADHGAIISQNSWGFKGETETPKSLKGAVDYFIKYAGIDENDNQVGPMRGGIVIFSAGNENVSTSGNSYGPIFNVASVGADYHRAYYSCYGDWIDISAPGGDAKKGNQVLSTLPNNRYGLFQGTSMACPHISGVAALIVSHYGKEGFTPTELERRMTESATPIQSFNKSFLMGAGLVNAYGAIAGSGGVAPDTPGDLNVQTQSNNLHFKITVPEDKDDGVPSAIKLYYSTKPFSSVSSELMFALFYLGKESAGDKLEGSVLGLEFNTLYYVSAAAIDLAGNLSGLTETVSVSTGSNSAPVIEPLGATSLTIKAHETGKIPFQVSDPDGHFYHIDLLNDTPGVSLDTLVREKPTILVKGPEAPSGQFKATLSVTDIYGANASQAVSITILENHAPVIANIFPDRIFQQGVATEELSSATYFSDEDGEELSYDFQFSNEMVVNMTYQGGKFYLTPMNYGYSDVTVTATDVRRLSVTQTFRVLVRDGNEDVDIYPNPVRDYLMVRTSEDATASLKLVNVSGGTVFEDTLTITPFEPAKVDVHSFPAGIYTVILDYGGKIISRQIVKL